MQKSIILATDNNYLIQAEKRLNLFWLTIQMYVFMFLIMI